MVTHGSADLARFRYHTGAPLRRVAPGEPCPVLFRDLGTLAMAAYLSGALARLAGPLTPLLYARTVRYREPYVDYEDIGRLVFIRPHELEPWHSGIAEVYVASASRRIAADAVGYAPPGMTLAQVEALTAGARDGRELREALGGRLHDEARRDAQARLEQFEAELREVEAVASRLRRAFQAESAALRAAARDEMARLGIVETDLCTTWHHLPRARRGELSELFRAVDARAWGAAP